MDELRVPRRRVRVRVVLDDGRGLDAEMFTALLGSDGRPERVIDHLNDPGEEFFPVAVGDDRFLLNKAGVVTLQIEGHVDEMGEPEAVEGHEVVVRLTMTGGLGLVGRVAIAMPPERSRVLDYLNAAHRFLPLRGEGVVTIVQRSHIISVRGD